MILHAITKLGRVSKGEEMHVPRILRQIAYAIYSCSWLMCEVEEQARFAKPVSVFCIDVRLADHDTTVYGSLLLLPIVSFMSLIGKLIYMARFGSLYDAVIVLP